MINYFECCHRCAPPKRYPGCSGSCPEYKEARARFDADKAKNNKDIAIRYYAKERNAIVKDRIAKYQSRRKGKNGGNVY